MFLWEPVVGGGIYAPGDLVQDTALLRVTDGYEVENPAMVDPATQYMPWLDWNRAELSDGRLPTWNPYNAGGSPHLANGQSAVLSPFSVPHYVLPVRWAPLVAAAMQLMVGGLLTYGLLRHLRRSFAAAVVGALAYAFCGSGVLWLHWPLSDAAALVPGTVWAASALVAADARDARDGRDPRRRRLAAAGLATAVAVGLLAGHVETTFVGVVLAGGFAAGRVARRWWRDRAAGRAGGRASVAARSLARLAGAGALGTAAAAVQLLPLLEYIGVSAARDFRGDQRIDPNHPLAFHLFPLALGHPGQRFTRSGFGAPPFLESAGLYVGGTVLVLAIAGAAAGLVGARAPRRHERAGAGRCLTPAFFAATALAALVYVHDVAGVASFLSGLPILDLFMASRVIVVWHVCVVVTAAFGFDALVAAGRRWAPAPLRARVPALAVGGAGAVGALGVVLLVGAAAWSARGVRNAHLRTDGALGDQALSWSNGHVVAVVAALAAGLAGVAAVLVAPGRRATTVAGVTVAASVFLQGGFLLRDVNPTVERRNVYPETSASRAIAEVVGDEQTLWLDGASLFPDVNLRYRWHSPMTYDALVVDAYGELYGEALRPPRVVAQGIPLGLLGGPVSPRGVGSLRALGIRYVVAGRADPFVEVEGLEQVAAAGAHRVLRVPGAPPRYFTPATVVAPEDAGRAPGRDPDFDPLRASVIDAPGVRRTRDAPGTPGTLGTPGEPGAARGTVEVLHESPTSVRVRVDRADAGWLVALRTRYPGWRATVDATPVDIAPANGAFMGVPVPAGGSEVELRYEPASVRLGGYVSVAAGAGIAALLVAGLVAAGPRSRNTPPITPSTTRLRTTRPTRWMWPRKRS